MSAKVIVAHPGRQHSYRLATALEKKGDLLYYVTTIYNKKKPSFLMKISNIFLRKDDKIRANKRRCEGIDDSRIIQYCEFGGIVDAYLSRKNVTLYHKHRDKIANKFGKKVAKLAIRENADAVIMYDTNATKCFEILKKKAPNIKRILDVSIADRHYMKYIYEREIKNSKSTDLKHGNEYMWNNKKMEYLLREVMAADHFFVASHFVRQSLNFLNIENCRISLIPYGANVECSVKKRTRDKICRFLFVGQINYRKGIPYLLEAFSQLDNSTLTLVGNYNSEDSFVKKYIFNEKIRFVGNVTFDKVKGYYESSDVFVIDSFAEGMAQVGIEAMACGLPLICSENSGVNDLIKDGVNGFVIPCGNTKVLKEKMQWFINNTDQIDRMGQRAKETAKDYTWENYEKKISLAIDKILGE